MQATANFITTRSNQGVLMEKKVETEDEVTLSFSLINELFFFIKYPPVIPFLPDICNNLTSRQLLAIPTDDDAKL